MTSYLPNPFSPTYAASKAFLHQFGASLGPEARTAAIDVLVRGWIPFFLLPLLPPTPLP